MLFKNIINVSNYAFAKDINRGYIKCSSTYRFL